MKIISAIVCSSLCLLSVVANSADNTETASMHVSLEVVKSCTLNANDLNFSRHGSDETVEIKASTQVEIICTNGTPFTLFAASRDASENGTFWLKPENNEAGIKNIAWKLYADEGKKSQITSIQGLTDTGTGSKQIENLYGFIDSGALTTAQAGTYADDVTLNLVY
ncbi:spore coat protein U domain-containing protein [Klebsiella aerogenes]|nr:spore coat protein U domain-containing protein [Klebsiella aerogenes]